VRTGSGVALLAGVGMAGSFERSGVLGRFRLLGLLPLWEKVAIAG
jgi:hypothetical protein